jgi:hypothetical protein
MKQLASSLGIRKPAADWVAERRSVAGFWPALATWAAARFHRRHRGWPFAQSRLQVGAPERVVAGRLFRSSDMAAPGDGHAPQRGAAFTPLQLANTGWVRWVVNQPVIRTLKRAEARAPVRPRPPLTSGPCEQVSLPSFFHEHRPPPGGISALKPHRGNSPRSATHDSGTANAKSHGPPRGFRCHP